MSPQLKAAFASELDAARRHYRAGDLDAAFARLERAHVLGQRATWPHAWSHLWMLRVGWRRRDGREVRGQLLRLPAALLFSRLWVPAGNTGGANVSALQPMPVSEDLRRLLPEHERA